MPPSVPPLTLSALAAVAAGGAIGSALRFAVAHAMRSWSVATSWPLATLFVNVVGSFVLGWLLARSTGSAATSMSEVTRAFAAVGVLGGFTTFSAFSGEVLMYLQAAQVGRAAIYATMSVVLSVGAAAAGFAVARGAA